jgi:hypothetical protein
VLLVQGGAGLDDHAREQADRVAARWPVRVPRWPEL